MSLLQAVTNRVTKKREKLQLCYKIKKHLYFKKVCVSMMMPRKTGKIYLGGFLL